MAAVTQDNAFKSTVLMKEDVKPVTALETNGHGPNPIQIAQNYLDSFQRALDNKDADAIVNLFAPNGYWRDILNIDFDMNSFKKTEIKDALSRFGFPDIKELKVAQPAKAAIVPASEELNWLQAFFKYETETARGHGFLRLVESEPGKGDWTAFSFFSALWEYKGHEEFAYERRPLGAEHGLHEDIQKNWLDKRNEYKDFKDSDPDVVIIGGGQNGLMLAARFSALGIPCLVVEKNERVGDSWRLRYKSLCLHDPVWADHFPYISYPPHWPIYCPKDKLANWMEYYAEAMELNVWTKSTVERDPKWDDSSKTWTVTVDRDGKKREMKVKHLVLATGFSGEPRLPSFPRDEYQGVCHHSSKHPGGAGYRGKKAVVVGCCNSGHDIAADFYENGADVTIVQRSHTYVMSSEHGIPGLLQGFYEENGPELADADVMLTSLPIEVINDFHIGATKKIAEKDKEILDGLEKVGFKLNRYPGGLFIKYFRDGGGYYIDVGASKLIADRKIKLKQGHEIVKLTKDGVLFDDGEELKADIVVLATGYTSARETIRRIVSDDVANRVGQLWGADKQGEIPTVWRTTGVEGFWVQVGNLFQARCYSKYLALQIQAKLLGLDKNNHGFPEYKANNDPRF